MLVTQLLPVILDPEVRLLQVEKSEAPVINMSFEVRALTVTDVLLGIVAVQFTIP